LDRADPAARHRIERRLEGPVFPSVLGYLWNWFHELSDARSSGGMGPCCITYQDIAAWSRLSGHKPSPWDVAVLRDLDRLWMSIIPNPEATGNPPTTDDGEIDGVELRDRLERAFDLFG
jgi:hypothetical protein